jgi:TetR/AcrR family transcriptional regulator, regulator of cefoperazone and chloramphenicol sensitivity
MLRSLRHGPHGHRHGGHGNAHGRGRPPRPRRGATQDDETRQRLLDAGRELFSEDGFHRVTVRDICHLARANVAAVNYHFGDKLGLYMEILRAGVALMAETNEMARVAGEGKPPEEQLRAYINVFVERVAGKDRQSWLQMIMMHEMANPTPALDIVFEQVIQPRFVHVGGIVAALLGCPYDDPRVLRCVLSVFGQCQVYLWSHLRGRILKDRPFTPEHIDELSNHVFEFSLAGIRGLAATAADSSAARR